MKLLTRMSGNQDADRAKLPMQQILDDVVADAQSARLKVSADADDSPPIAGHHIQWIGRRWNRSSAGIDARA